MRKPGELVIQVAMSEAEMRAIGAICRAGGYSSIANAVRSALWSLGDDFGMDFESGVFDQRSQPCGKPRGSRRMTPRTAKAKPSGGASRPQAAAHPWKAGAAQLLSVSTPASVGFVGYGRAHIFWRCAHNVRRKAALPL